MAHYTFNEVAMRRSVKINCRSCGKTLTRVLKEYQTANPYNRNALGYVKSATEIRAELPAALDRVEAKIRERGVLCKACDA